MSETVPLRKIWQRMIRHRRRRQGRHDGGLLFRSPFRAIKLIRFRRKRSVTTMRLHAITARGTYSITTVRCRLTPERGGARRYYFVVNGQEQIPRTRYGFPDSFDTVFVSSQGAQR